MLIKEAEARSNVYGLMCPFDQLLVKSDLPGELSVHISIIFIAYIHTWCQSIGEYLENLSAVGVREKILVFTQRSANFDTFYPNYALQMHKNAFNSAPLYGKYKFILNDAQCS